MTGLYGSLDQGVGEGQFLGVPFEGVVRSEDYGFVFYDVYLFSIVSKETSSDLG